jgi:predicted Zn-dependent peptidase
MTLDQEVLGYLKDLEFQRRDNKNGILFHNKTNGLLQQAQLNFVASYDNPKEAGAAEALVDFYLEALASGTKRCPSVDSFEKDITLQGLHFSEPFTSRDQERLTLTVPIVMQDETALKKTIKTVDEIFETSILLDPKTEECVLEDSREFSLRSLDEQLGDHKAMAEIIEERLSFSDYEVFTYDDHVSLIENLTLCDLKDAFRGLISRSFPVGLLSGKMDAGIFSDITSGFISKHTGNGNESILHDPEVCKMKIFGEPYHAFGPSEQMHFIRSYPLKEIPTIPEERFALYCANNIFGGDFSSLLMRTIREKYNLVYNIKSTYSNFQNRFIINTEHNKNSYKKIESLTQEIFEDFAKGNFTREQFDLQKEKMVEALLVSEGKIPCDHPEFRINHAYNRIISKSDPMSSEEKYRIFSEVTYEDTRSAVEKFIDPSQNQVFTYSNVGDRDGT